MADTCNVNTRQKKLLIKLQNKSIILINLSCHKKIQTKIWICYINTLRKCHYIINIPENIYQTFIFFIFRCTTKLIKNILTPWALEATWVDIT